MNNSLSTCNFTSLGNYDGFANVAKTPNTLSNIINPFVKYPVQRLIFLPDRQTYWSIYPSLN